MRGFAAEDGRAERINSFLALSRDRALAQAAKMTRWPPRARRCRRWRRSGGIKDVLTMKGSPATAGSKILQGYMPPYDATAVTGWSRPAQCCWAS